MAAILKQKSSKAFGLSAQTVCGSDGRATKVTKIAVENRAVITLAAVVDVLRAGALLKEKAEVCDLWWLWADVKVATAA